MSRRMGVACAIAMLVVASGLAMRGPSAQGQADADQPPLPGEVVVDVDAIESRMVRLGLFAFGGSDPQRELAASILQNDFTLFPGYQVLQEDSETPARSLTPRLGAFSGRDVRGVVTGFVQVSRGRTGSVQAELRYYDVARPGEPAYEKTFRGREEDLRAFVHGFGNDLLERWTRKAGPFGSHITFARRVAPGRKDIHCGHMDGFGLMRVTNGRGIAMLPGFDDEGKIWFTRLTPSGMYITRTGRNGRAILEGGGLTMAPSICAGRVYFASSRDGNSEIYSARLDGTDIQRLTNHPAIDVSPTCGPGGKVAFISARHGNPQVWWMNRDGSQPERLTFQGAHNQTPAFCRDPSVPLVAFTGRDGNLDIFTVNTQTKEILRLTQGQGNNKDPAFSPDCRMVAFASDRRGAPGIYLSSLLGFNQHRVVVGEAETIRWMHR